MPPEHPSCLHLGSRGSKRAVSLCSLLVLLVFPSVYSVSPVALWYYLMLLDFPFMLSPYLFDLSWAPPAQVLLGLHGISISSVLAAQTLRMRRGAFTPGFLGVSDQMTS